MCYLVDKHAIAVAFLNIILDTCWNSIIEKEVVILDLCFNIKQFL